MSMLILKIVKKKLCLILRNNMNLQKLKFPIGEFETPSTISTKEVENWIATITNFPKEVETITDNLTIEELNWLYRPNGWNIKQVVHHCSDSHINAFMRFKLALTEEHPTIKPYAEDLWANLVDGSSDDISHSMMILKAIHYKWSLVLKAMTNEDWERTYFHPESKKLFQLKEVASLYAWHCNHHLAHIKQALAYKNQFE